MLILMQPIIGGRPVALRWEVQQDPKCHDSHHLLKSSCDRGPRVSYLTPLHPRFKLGLTCEESEVKGG